MDWIGDLLLGIWTFIIEITIGIARAVQGKNAADDYDALDYLGAIIVFVLFVGIIFFVCPSGLRLVTKKVNIFY